MYATEWQQWDRHTHGNSYLVLFLVLFLFFWENHLLYSVFWAASQPKESYLKGYILERISVTILENSLYRKLYSKDSYKFIAYWYAIDFSIDMQLIKYIYGRESSGAYSRYNRLSQSHSLNYYINNCIGRNLHFSKENNFRAKFCYYWHCSNHSNSQVIY